MFRILIESICYRSNAIGVFVSYDAIKKFPKCKKNIKTHHFSLNSSFVLNFVWRFVWEGNAAKKISLSTFITFCKRPLYTQNMLKMSEYQRLVLQTKYMKNACRSTLKKPVFITNIYTRSIVILCCFDDIIHVTAKFAIFLVHTEKKLKIKRKPRWCFDIICRGMNNVALHVLYIFN